jgi:tetratricopeptide (TPR) repeat protein
LRQRADPYKAKRKAPSRCIWNDPKVMMGQYLNTAILIVLASFWINPTSPAKEDTGGRIQLLYQDAVRSEKQGRIDQAIGDYQAITRLNPKLAAAYNNLGRLYWQKGNLEAAITTLKHACKLNPALAAAHAMIGFSYYEMRHFTAAQRELAEALKLRPTDRNVKLFLARSMEAAGDFEGAMELLDQLRKEDPRNPEVLFSLGSVYAELAKSTLTAIQTIDPNSYLVEVLLARSDEAQELYSDAAVHYNKAIEKAPIPNVPDLYYHYGHVLWLAGHFQEALAEYRRVLELNPYDYRACWEASRILLPSSPKEALRLANQALKLKPDLPEGLEVRGSALLALGDPQKAINDLERSADLEPGDPQVHFELAKAYRQVGMPQQAKIQFSIYEQLQEKSHTPAGKDAVPTH